jgi:hypothetical protein
MPLFTPSRLLLTVLSLSFFSLLLRFGLPHAPHARPLPVAGHDVSPGFPLEGDLIPDPPRKAQFPTAEEQKVVLGAEEKDEDEDDDDEPRPPGSTKASTICSEVRGARDTMIIVKTSKAELDGKLPPHLATLLACAPHVAIFSDYAGTVDGYPIYDALENTNATLRAKHDEFREYKKMQASASYTPTVAKAEKLHKWKYLPMVYRTYRMKPNLRFYLFIEADMTLSWTNLLQWFARLDYRIPYYTGAPMFSGATRYAQQRSGILVSFAAIRLYAKAYDERYAREWEPHIGSECCGDIVLATAMADSHVEMAGSWPMLQAEAPGTLDWTKKHWCTPIVSWHGANAQETDMLWAAQKRWTKKHGWTTPYLARNAFEEFVLPQLEEEKTDWDNMSSDTIIKGEPGSRGKLTKAQSQDSGSPQTKPVLSSESIPGAKPIISPRPSPQPQSAELPPTARTSTDHFGINPPPLHRSFRRASLTQISATIANAADNATTCHLVCKKTQDCLQWKYSDVGDGECHLGKVLRLGRKVGDMDRLMRGTSWTSGWMVERVKEVSDTWGKCERANWAFNQ